MKVPLPLPAPPVPPMHLQLPDFDELPASQPLCTPVDQPIHASDNMPQTPGRTTIKRRRTRGPFFPTSNPAPFPLAPKLALASRARPAPPPPPLNPLLNPLIPTPTFSDDFPPLAIAPASQRTDLPDMSQDTLALFSKLVQEHQHGHTPHGHTPRPPDPDYSPLFKPASASVIPTDYPHSIRRTDSTRTSLARASLISTLSGARSMDNPFLNPTTPPKTPAEIRTPHTAGQFPIIKKTANASESFQNLAPVLDFDETFLLPPDLKNSLGTRKPEPVDSIFATHDKHKEKHEILKVLLVASTQGRKFSLDFEQVRVAGKGAFSEVLQARHRLDGCTYAIKRNITPLMSDKSRLDSLQEVFALSALQGHPNILRYHDAWFEEKGRYLHMQTEFLSEGTLYALFIERGKRMPSEELLALAADLSSALAFMHSKGVVHLDVKPDNIFRSNRGRTQNSFIIGDFGLACHMDGTDARSTEGDSRYLCPEAMDGSPKQIPDTEEDLSDCASDDEDLIGDTLKPAAPQDLRARDVFSLGATIYELAVGLPLKKSGEEWRQLRSDTARAAKEAGAACGSSEIANIVQVCLEANPSRRALACDVVDICEANSSREQSRYINQLHMQLDQLKRQLSRHQKVTNNLLKNGERNRKRYREQCANGKKRFPPCAV